MCVSAGFVSFVEHLLLHKFAERTLRALLFFFRSGKDCALKLNLLPPGTVSSEVILDGEYTFPVS